MTISRINAKVTFMFGALLVASALAMSTITPAFAANALSVSAGVIPLGGSVTITQTLDSPASGTVLSLLVLETDGDTCAATTTPAPVSGSTSYSATYPDDFAIAIAGGDGTCDTGDVGVYNAESQVDGTAGPVTFRVEFETNFFVIPESPIGVAALMGSSLAALGGYLGLRRIKASV
jgi:hypothetical protein